MIICYLISGCSPSVNSDNIPQTKKWKASIAEDFSAPTGRHGNGFVSVGRKLFLLGGRGMKPSDVYDLDKEIWTEKKAPPIEVHHFQPVAHGHLIYILGAMTGPYPYENPIDHIVIYDTQKDQWIRGADIPQHRRRGSTGAAKIGDHIYMFCGIKNGHIGDHKNWVDRYDINTHEWTELPDAPRARDHFQVEHIQNKIYLIGGRTTKAFENAFKNTVKEVDVFDVTSMTWSSGFQNIPTERAGAAVSKIKDNILVAGGESFYQAKAHDEVEVLNVTNMSWTKMDPLPIGRHGTGMAMVDGKFYICTGGTHQGGGPELSDLYVLEN